MAVWELSMYGQLTTKITAAVLATVIVVALLVPVVMSVSTEYTSAYNSGQRYSTDIDGEHQIGIAKNGVSYEITTDGNANPSPIFIDTDVDPDPQQSVQPTPGPSRSPLRGEPVRAVQTWTSGATTCTFDDATGVFTVGGTGAMENYSHYTNQPWESVRESITSLVIQSGVTHLGQNTFYGCTALTSVTISDTVTSMGRGVFYGCTALTSITIPASVTSLDNAVFYGCTALTSITIPASVTSLGNNMFFKCASLTSITFESSTWNITHIGTTAFALGGSSGPMITATIYSPNNVQNGQLDAYRGNFTTLTYVGYTPDYTVTITVNDPAYGSVDTSSLSVPSGTSISASGNVLTIGSNTVTQTPASATAQYTYSFTGWSGIPSGGTITQDTVITANFTRTVNDYTVTIQSNNTDYGTVSQSTVTVPYGTSISASSNVLAVGSTNVTATPNTATAQYTFAFANWSNVPSGGTVTADVTVTANFTATVNTYTVSIVSNNTDYGTVNQASLTVPYGTSMSISSNILTVGGTNITQTPATATAQYTYSFNNWSGAQTTVTGDMTVTANFIRTTNTYTVSIVSSNTDYGTVDTPSVTVPYGTAIGTAANVLTIGSNTITATPKTATAQYTFAFGSWTGTAQTVTGNMTITANFTATVNSYTVSIVSNNTSYGTVDVPSVTVPYGTAISTASNVLTIGSNTITATPNTATAQYTYAFGSWSGATSSVTGDMTITANFTATVNTYTVSIVSNNTDYGTVDTASVTVDYGTSISAVQNVLTIGSNTVTATPAQATAQYTYAFANWTGTAQTVTDDMTITANFTRSVNDYTVTITVNDSTYGSVDTASVTVPYGTSVSTSANVLTIGSNTVTQTPATATQQYTYSFGSWTGTAQTVTADMTITANFTRATNEYTVTITVNDPAYGSVDTASVTVPYGTAMGTSQNVLTIGSNTVTQTPTAATAQYTYSFDNWTGTTATVTGDMAVTANFSRTVNEYTVTITVNDGTWGTVDVPSVTVPYGTAVSASGNVLSVGSTDVTATPAQATAQYTYAFGSWTGTLATVTGDMAVTANFTRTVNQYTVTIQVNDPSWGSVSPTSVTVDYGTPVSAVQNVLTVGSTDVTATPQTATQQYSYAFDSWNNVPQTVTGNVTVTADFIRAVNQYFVTIQVNDADYGTVDHAYVQVDYGTSVSASGNILTVGSTNVTATPNQPTAQYTFAFSEWQNAPQAVTGNVTVTAVFTATVNQYTVTVNVNESSYGSVSPASVTVDYGTVISASGNVLTVGSTDITQTPATATVQYTYSFGNWTGTAQTVTGDMTVTANFIRTVNQYTVTVNVNDAGYGSVSPTSVTVDYGTSVSVQGNILYVGTTPVTQTPATASQQYSYAFSDWTDVPQTVVGDTAVTANFVRTVNQYTVSITVNDATYGTVDVQTVTVDYGATISAASNVLTVGSTDVTATANQPTAQYTYAFSSWSGVPAGGTVTDDLTVTAVFTATVNEYHVHIQVNDARQGSVDVSDVTVPYGTTMTVNDNVLTINTSPATVVTASVNAPTAQYTFQFTDWVNTGTVTGDVNVVARYTVITNEYTVTFAVNDSNYGYVSEASITALYGTSVTVEGNSVTVGSYDSTAYANDPTAQYTYAFVDWSGAPQTVTGDVTITANFTRTVNQYTVQIVSNNTDYGTVDTASVTVDYGTSVTVSSNVLTVGSNTVTATPATSTPQWTYVFSEWQNVPQAVTGNVTVTAVFTATHLVYTVTFVTNGGTPVTAQEVEQGQTATRPADPYLFSYYLVNWYSDDALTTAYNFATPVTGDTIVYQGYAPDRYSLIAYGSDGLVVLFDRSGALVYVGGGEGNVLLATITQGSSYNLVLTDGELTAGEETATVTGFVHPRGNLAYGQNQWMNADSPFGVFGIMNTTTSGGADIGFSYAVTGIVGNHEDAVVEQSYGDRINSIECAQEIVDARVNGATVSIVTESSDSASYTDAYILAPYEIRTYNPDYVGDTLATLLMAIAVFCVLGIIAMVGYNRVKG